MIRLLYMAARVASGRAWPMQRIHSGAGLRQAGQLYLLRPSGRDTGIHISLKIICLANLKIIPLCLTHAYYYLFSFSFGLKFICIIWEKWEGHRLPPLLYLTVKFSLLFFASPRGPLRWKMYTPVYRTGPPTSTFRSPRWPTYLRRSLARRSRIMD